jgi:hypothetical protein
MRQPVSQYYHSDSARTFFLYLFQWVIDTSQSSGYWQQFVAKNLERTMIVVLINLLSVFIYSPQIREWGLSATVFTP